MTDTVKPAAVNPGRSSTGESFEDAGARQPLLGRDPRPAVSVGPTEPWTQICAAEAVAADRGVAGIVAGAPVAIFRLSPPVGSRNSTKARGPSQIAGVIDDANGDLAISGGRPTNDDPGLWEWRAVSHIDPMSGAPIMARGLVGSIGSGLIVTPTVASPLHKHRYNLRSGYCLDDDNFRLDVYEVRVVNEVVECRPMSR